MAVREIFFALGPIHASPATLLTHSNQLLNAWAVMKQPTVIDLGACDCLGEKRAARNRRFLVDAVPLEEGGEGGLFLFALVSHPDADFDAHARRALRKLLTELTTWTGWLPPSTADTERWMESTMVRFSPRERQILEAVAAGCTNKEIARILGTSPNTVRNQIARMMRRLGLRKRTQLAMLWRPGGPPAGNA